MTVPAQHMSFASAYRQLRPVEKTFVDAYVVDIERQADKSGERISLALYRPIPADVIEASRGLLDRPMVRAAITERINEIAADSELSPRRIIRELMPIAFSSVADYMQISEGYENHDSHTYFDLSKCTPEQLSAIASVEVEEGVRGGRKFKFKLHPKMDAIKTLMQYAGMLDPDNPHWRADNAKPAVVHALPATATEADAGDRYAQMIGG